LKRLSAGILVTAAENCIILAGIKGIGSSARMRITADGQQHLKVMNGGGGSVHLAATM